MHSLRLISLKKGKVDIGINLELDGLGKGYKSKNLLIMTLMNLLGMALGIDYTIKTIRV